MDPHVKTWAGNDFDFMGECDLVLLDAPDFNNGLGLHIDVRTTIRYDYSYIESAALRIGEDILEVESFGEYAVNGVESANLDFLGGYEIVHTIRDEKVKIFEVIISEADDFKIVISTFKDMVNVKIVGHVEALGLGSGMMGSTSTGTMLGRDGRIMDLSTDEGINAFGYEWQVTKDEPMLFRTARFPQASKGEKCVLPDASTKQSLRRRLAESGVSRAAAENACAYLKTANERKNCVLDVLEMGDLDAAQAGAF